MRVKVLEALAAGKAVVASPLAVEGLDLLDGEQVVLAESDPEFSQAIARLFDFPDQRTTMARRARAWACANLDWETAAGKYEALYRRLIFERSHG
jgi:glycosyltransferase involved in cell wall biosynthesis